jgi:hypothetical protein
MNPQSTSTPSKRNVALLYAKHGWKVFQLAPGEKVPRKGSSGILAATSDPETINKWWTKEPDANIGIALAASGLGMLDVDVHKENGHESMAELELYLGKPLCCAIQKTPSGGLHYIFKNAGGLIDRVKWRKGLDVMTKPHRYVVAWPSTVAKGRYKWQTGERPWADAGTLPMPWLSELDSGRPIEDDLLGPAQPSADSKPDLLDIAALRVPGVAFDELSAVLAVLPPEMERDRWLRVIWGAAAQWAGSLKEDDAIEAVEEWSSRTDVEGQYKKGEVKKRWKEHTSKNGGSSGAGHVTWRGVRAMAREHGWSPVAIFGIKESEWKDHLHKKKVENADGSSMTVTLCDGWNCALYLAYDEDLKGAVRQNALSGAVELWKANVAPLHAEARLPAPYNPKSDIPGIAHAIYQKIKGHPSRESVEAAVNAAARVHQYDPMHQWLDTLKWDGVGRIDSWLTRVCGVADTELHRAIGRAWLIGLAARMGLEAGNTRGVKMDSVLVLQGGEGIGKSSVGRLLGGDWYASFSSGLGDDEVLYVIERSAILELEELDSLNRAEASRVKALVSSQTDTFRRKYEASAAQRPRRCVFLGTTNDSAFLTEDMTLRRWWVVQCGDKAFDLKWLQENREQLVAEARVCWDLGEQPVLPVSLRGVHRESVEDVHVSNPIVDAVFAWSHRKAVGDEVTMKDVVEEVLSKPYTSASMSELKRVGAAVRVAGWKRVFVGGESSRARGWKKL